MDDIKNMDVEEEEGGWAGHHEEVDYSKEVVFSDSSDEENSGRPSQASKSKSGQFLKGNDPLARQRSLEGKGDGGKLRKPDHEKVEERLQSWRSNSPQSPTEKEGRERHRPLKERHENEPTQRHEVSYHHPYPQRPGPYPPAHQYPPNYPPYHMYPPPAAFGPRGAGHHYPPHAGGSGNRYPPHRGGGSHKRGPLEREEHGWGQERENRGGGRRKWEDKPIILAKNEKTSTTTTTAATTTTSPEEKGVTSGELSETPQTEPRKINTSLETQDDVEKTGVTFSEECEGSVGPEEQAPATTRRGNQPKIMLRKLGDKETEGGGSRVEGRDRPADLKNLRAGDGEDTPGTEATGRPKMAWNVTDRGPIVSPKTLYEPEGKKSADKFKKYQHAQMESHRGAKSEQDEGAGPGEGDVEKVKSPVERKEGMKMAKTETEGLKQRDSQKSDSLRTPGQDAVGGQSAEFTPQQSQSDKPHHRKEDSRRPKGGPDRAGRFEMSRQDGERRDEARAQDREHRPKGSGTERRPEGRDYQGREYHGKPENRADYHSKPDGRDHHGGKAEGRADYHNKPEGRDYHAKGEGRGDYHKHDEREQRNRDRRQDTRHENAERRNKDGPRRDTQEANRGGGGRHFEKRPSDHRPREERNRKKDLLSSSGVVATSAHSYGGEQVGRAERKPRKETGPRPPPSDPPSRVADKVGTKRPSEEAPSRVPAAKRGCEEEVESPTTVVPPTAAAIPTVVQGKPEDGGRSRGQATGGRGQPKKPAQRREEKKPERERERGSRTAFDKPFPKTERPAKPNPPRLKEDPSKASAEHPRRAQHREMGTGSSEMELALSATDKASSQLSATSQGNNRRAAGQRRDERRLRGNRRAEEEQEETVRRGGVGRGRGRDGRREGNGRAGTQDKQAWEEQRKTEKPPSVVGKDSAGSSVVTEDSSSSSLVESSGSVQKFDVSRYDLNSHKVAVVDDIGGQTLEEGLLSPTAQDEFVEVTSKKAQKEKIRKEKEEQRREEKRLEDQRKRKKAAPTRNQGGVEKVSSNKPYSAWSTTEGKDSSEAWNAAPGSQLKTTTVLGLPSSQAAPQWREVPATGFSLGATEGGGGGGTGGEAKAAMPHTAELVTSTESSMNPSTLIPSSYYLFGYSPFSPATTMLDAAVDSTIGTVTSPRALSAHTPLLLDPPSLSLENPLVPETLSATELVANSPSRQAPQLPTGSKAPGENLPPQQSSKGLPPRLKAGAGRGRGAGPKGGATERRRKGRFEKDQVGKQDRQYQNAPSNEVSFIRKIASSIVEVAILLGVHYLEWLFRFLLCKRVPPKVVRGRRKNFTSTLVLGAVAKDLLVQSPN